jgi:molybdate transport system ATP-binding protein
VSLKAHIALRRGVLDLDARLDARHGEIMVLLGPNGSGKTTMLRALAGLLPLERGRVELDGVVFEDAQAGIRVPTEHRSLGLLFQDYVLFPHLSAVDNVAFGLRSGGLPKKDARRLAAEWLSRVGLPADHHHARPRTLSGGQAQRVALARALARDPGLLLLDEPLAALDASARAGLRRELRRHLVSFEGTCLVVTHDPIEAVALADTLVVLEAGRVTQTGSPGDVTAHPRSRYVADLVGINLLRGRVRDDVVQLPGGARLTSPSARDAGDEVFAVIQPAAVALHRAHPDGSPQNVWRGTAEIVDIAGDRVRVQVSGELPLVAEITPDAVAALDLGSGGEVWAAVKATEIRVYPA